MHDTRHLSRREVIRRAMSACGGAAMVSTGLLSSACAATRQSDRRARDSAFTAEDIAWLDEVADTILPQTDTPGARAAQVGAFIALMVTDTYAPDEQLRFRAGMSELERQCRLDHDTGFMTASPAQRLSLLQRLDQEQYDQVETDPRTTFAASSS